MGSLTKLETALDGVLGEKSSFKLPQGARKSLAGAMWWLALIFGVLQLWAAYALWDLGHRVDRVVDYVNSLATYYGTQTTTNLGLFFYVSLLTIVVVGVLLLFAVPGLKNMKKAGWDLVFYSMLVQAVVAVARLFSNVGGGFGDFLGAAIAAVIGAYFLFQVRSYFTGKSAEAKK